MNTCRILGVHFCVTTLEEASDWIIMHRREAAGEYISLCNVHTTVMAMEDPDYLEAENRAVLTLPDGKPIVTEERKRGFPDAERTGGPDLMDAVFRKTSKGQKGEGLRHYFYGSSPEVLQALQEKLPGKYPGIIIAGALSPPFRALSAKEEEEIREKISAAAPDIIWVGLGAPKQEKWMLRHRGIFNGIMIGVGAGFDFHAGTKKRAPVWMQRASLEWLYRLMQEPGRLFGRYFHSNTSFLLKVGKDRRQERTK